jgi:3-dehydroquinate dehydratase-1
MTAASRAQQLSRPRVVGVIASRADLDRATRMRSPPDLFEVRLDCLVRVLEHLETKLRRLRAPLIVTARHPFEGGANSLSLQERRDLLRRFLPHAKYVDVELRSAFALRSLLRSAEQRKVRRIISFHNFKSTPPLRVLAAKAHAARAHGANIFKAATRTDTPNQLARLLQLVATEDVDLPVSAMGIGKLGAMSRVLLARAGSVLVYASITARTDLEGQLSLEQLRVLGIATPLKRKVVSS